MEEAQIDNKKHRRVKYFLIFLIIFNLVIPKAILAQEDSSSPIQISSGSLGGAGIVAACGAIGAALGGAAGFFGGLGFGAVPGAQGGALAGAALCATLQAGGRGGALGEPGKKVAAKIDGAGSEIVASVVDSTVGNAVKFISWFIFVISKWIFSASGYIFDNMIKTSLSNNFYNIPVIREGWIAFRDLANMLFIFAILYLAITTILSSSGANTGQALTMIIMAALFVNFSFAISRTVIDASNILANEFFKQTSTNSSLSATFLNAFDFQNRLLTQIEEYAEGGAAPENVTQAMVYLGGSAFLAIAGFTFAAGGFTFLARTFILILLIIFSPLAFAAFATNDTRGYGQMWLKQLLNNAFVAPIFLSVIWVAAKIVNSPDFVSLRGSGKYDFLLASTPKGLESVSSNLVSLIFSYGIVIFLLISATVVSKTLAPKAAGFGADAAGKFFGFGLGATAFAGRQFIGGYAKKLAENKDYGTGPNATRFQRMARVALDTAPVRGALSGLAGTSFDPRSLGIPGTQALGQATGAGGFLKEGDIMKKFELPKAGTALEQQIKKEKKEEITEARDDAEKARIKSQENFVSAISSTNADVTKIRDISDGDIRRMVKDNKDFFANKEFVKHLTASQLEAVAKSGELDRSVMADIADAVKQKYANGPATDETDYLNNSTAAHRWRR